MTSKQALTELFNEANRFPFEKPKYDTYELLKMSEQIQNDLEILEQLKTIEKELGIDLVTLNKLRKADKIYVTFFDEIQEWNKIKVDLRYCTILYGYNAGKGYGLFQPLSNYGIGFALTKEELENEN